MNKVAHVTFAALVNSAPDDDIVACSPAHARNKTRAFVLTSVYVRLDVAEFAGRVAEDA